jgi:Divergent InlB B-repeat domain
VTVRRLLASVLVAAAAACVVGEVARAAPWCGTTATEDRPPALAGRTIHVALAFPADGADRSAELAPRISADVDEIAAWWQGQDASREPRFDRVAFACGLQADIRVLRLSDSAATLRAGATRGDRLVAAVGAALGRSRFDKQLVYYDGPVDDPDSCGQGAGSPDGNGVALVYLAACTDVPTARVAAHEILHAFGALPIGAPHACPDTRGHPCDSLLDLLYPYASTDALAAMALDVGRDDYYGHGGAWPDLQDSGWLRLVGQQVRLALQVRGSGSVSSDVPGVECEAGCVTEWDTGTAVALEASPGDGQRFVRWSGSCAGAGLCELTLDQSRSVTALFAPERFRLIVSVLGRGTVNGAGGACRVARCQRSLTSYEPARLRATPAAGWRLAGWSGGCTGRAAVCTVSMQNATTVRARFVRR